jgi:proline iminopeptidase
MKTIYSILIICIPSLVSAQDFEGMKIIHGANLFLSVKGKGENIVVLHGGPGLNHRYFRPHLDALEKKFKVVYYDQRASGKSSTPSPDSITIKFFVEDLESIRKELKLEKLNLLAHSWGAVLATHYAMAYPQQVNKIIYSNPAMLSREYDGDAGALSKKKTTKEDSIARANIFKGGPPGVKEYEQLMRLNFNTSAFDRNNMQKLVLDLPSNFLEANKALFTGLSKDPAMQTNLYDALQGFRFPTLIIHGEADVLPAAHLERMKNNLPSGKVVVLKKSGHFPFVEEPEEYLRIVAEFFRGR